MSIHTRAIVRGRRKEVPFWEKELDFGIPFIDHTQASKHEKVVEAVKDMQKFYPIVQVTFRDAG